MVYSYYARLSAKNKAIYRASDRVSIVRVPRPERVQPLTAALRAALMSEDRRRIEIAARAVTEELLVQLRVPPLRVRVLAVRPHGRDGELHGLYAAEDGKTAQVRVWMRTARNARVVAFRTFLRTLLHEIVHHLDYRLLKLGDSYHTEGFFRRESSLFRQIVADPVEAPARASRGTPKSAEARRAASTTAPKRRAVPTTARQRPQERQARLDFGDGNDS